MKICVKLFGKAKEFHKEETVEFIFSAPILVSDLRLALVRSFSDYQDREVATRFVDDCALGSADQILNEKYMLEGSQVLVLLPPVCGG